MKRYLTMIFPLLAFAGCKAELAEINEQMGTGRDVILETYSSSLKTILDPSTLKVNWVQGDKMTIWSKGTAKSIILSAVSSGAQATFIGTENDLDTSKKLFAFYPSESISMQESGFSGCNMSNHSQQSGLLSDFGKYQLCYTSELMVNSSGDKLVLSYNGEPSSILSIVKFSIKEGIDVRSITIQGFDDAGNPMNVAGDLNFNPEVPEIISTGSENEIVINRDGNVINGDVYVFISPNSHQITDTSPAINNATKLKFTFTNSNGKTCEYTNLLESPLAAGTVTNLGSITKMTFADPSLYVVRGGESWAQLNQKKDILEGSALDFSGFAVDAPAGKYGLLKACDNHFEFADKAGVPQYFYGANVTGSACAPSKDKADIIAARLARIGYNSVRFHHYDDLWEENATDENGDTFRDRMDKFAACLINRGLYLTMDMHSSRITSQYSVSHFKLFSLIGAALADDSSAIGQGYTEAYDNWCGFTDSVLDHTNPYTGHKWAEEPALIMITVLNEPGLKKIWTENLTSDAAVIYAWKNCFSSSRSAPSFPSEVSVGDYYWGQFIQWLQSGGYSAMVNYIKAKNYKSLLAVAYDNCCYLGNASGLSSFDVHDSHSYVDHPTGDLPSRTCDGVNPLLELPDYINTSTSRYKDILSQRPGVPHTLTEWNHCTPNPLRALGAIHGSAFLRSRGWDGIWRFAYAQGYSNYFEKNQPNSFDVSKDEVMKASEAGVVSFYLRGDITEPSSQLSYTEAEFSAITERSIALYRQGMGTKTAGILTANTRIYPATILITSMDGKNIQSSDRILLANITDCAGNGASFTDSSKRVTVSYGSGQFIRISESDISLALNNPSLYKVYELDANGERNAEIQSSVSGEKLCFTVAVRGTDGSAHLYYEIVNE